MKSKFLVYMVMFIYAMLCCQQSDAQIIGKMYQPGDTIIMDGVYGIVFKTDESGLHGKVISSRYLLNYHTDTKTEKILSKVTKEMEKKIKKGEASQAEMEMELAAVKRMDAFPNILSAQVRSSSSLRKYQEQLPQGWRFPNYEDCNDFSLFQLGQPVGERKAAFLKNVATFNSKDMQVKPLRWLLQNIAVHGIITDIDGDVRYMKYDGRGTKGGYKIKDEYVLEFGAFVKDF